MTCSAVRCGAVRCVGTVSLSERLPRFGRSQTGESLRPQKGRQLSSIPVGPSARPRFVYRCATLRGSFVRSLIRRAPQAGDSLSTALPALARHAVLPSIMLHAVTVHATAANRCGSPHRQTRPCRCAAAPSCSRKPIEH
jgi:hypothetical protein